MCKVQSVGLTEFYRAYKKWLDEGSPDKRPFWRSCGLCGNIEVTYLSSAWEVENELSEQFAEEGLCGSFPFGAGTYKKEQASGEQHLNPLRIKWVEDHLKPEFTGEEE